MAACTQQLFQAVLISLRVVPASDVAAGKAGWRAVQFILQVPTARAVVALVQGAAASSQLPAAQDVHLLPVLPRQLCTWQTRVVMSAVMSYY